MHPSKITVTKSLTVEKLKKWEKAEYTLEVELDKNDDPTTAKLWASSLIDIWLTEFGKTSK